MAPAGQVTVRLRRGVLQSGGSVEPHPDRQEETVHVERIQGLHQQGQCHHHRRRPGDGPVLPEDRRCRAERRINPLIAGIVGESNFTNIGLNLGDPPEPGQGAAGGDKDISIGLVIDAAISFVAVAFFLFLIIKAYNKYAAAPAAETPAGPTEIDLLTEIRDSLSSR